MKTETKSRSSAKRRRPKKFVMKLAKLYQLSRRPACVPPRGSWENDHCDANLSRTTQIRPFKLSLSSHLLGLGLPFFL